MKPSNPSKIILPSRAPRVVGTSIRKDASYHLQAAKGTGPIKPYQPDKNSTGGTSLFLIKSHGTLPTINEDEMVVF